METKRFIGPDMRSALRAVREQLGPDAVILSNRRVGGGVEIIAADGEGFDDTPAAAAAPEPAIALRAALGDRDQLTPARTKPAPHQPASPDALVEVRGELRELRDLVERRLAVETTGVSHGARGTEGAVWRQLTRSGLPNDIVSALMASLAGDADVDMLVGTLADAIPEAGDVVARGGVIAAVGPTGAGKTTTLCKLAVRHALERGPESLVLASVDTARLGGVDMLRAVARLLEVPFLTAMDGESVTDLIARAGNPGLLLLDTPGLNRRRPGDARRLQELAAAGVNSLLVLPANAQFAWLDAAAGDYRAARPVAAVVTKLDETVSLGEAIGVLLREGLPVAYVTDGPEIPDDIHLCDALAIARRAVSMVDSAADQERSTRPAVARSNVARIA